MVFDWLQYRSTCSFFFLFFSLLSLNIKIRFYAKLLTIALWFRSKLSNAVTILLVKSRGEDFRQITL